MTDEENVILIAKLAATLIAGDLGSPGSDGYRYLKAGDLNFKRAAQDAISIIDAATDAADEVVLEEPDDV